MFKFKLYLTADSYTHSKPWFYFRNAWQLEINPIRFALLNEKLEWIKEQQLYCHLEYEEGRGVLYKTHLYNVVFYEAKDATLFKLTWD